jgi:hypothetical protein
MKDGKIETDADIRKLLTPTKGPVRYTVAGVPGLMVTVSTKGSKAFAFRYRTRSGRWRLHTIGQCSMVRDDPDSWSIASARAEARALPARTSIAVPIRRASRKALQPIHRGTPAEEAAFNAA